MNKNDLDKIRVMTQKEIIEFNKGYNEYNKFNDILIEPKRKKTYNIISITKDISESKDKVLKNVGKTIAIKENKIIINELLNMKDKYDEKTIFIDNLKDAITKYDPDKKLTLIMNHFLIAKLQKRKLVDFNNHIFLNRQIIVLPMDDDKIMLFNPELFSVNVTDNIHNIKKNHINYMKYLNIEYLSNKEEKGSFYVITVIEKKEQNIDINGVK